MGSRRVVRGWWEERREARTRPSQFADSPPLVPLVFASALDPIHHTHSRPQIVEAEAASRAIVLAELVQSPLVLVHVSAGGAALAIRDAQGKDLPIFGETCPQYLFLSECCFSRQPSSSPFPILTGTDRFPSALSPLPPLSRPYSSACSHSEHADLTKFAPPNVFENSKHVCSPPPGPDGTDQEAIWRCVASLFLFSPLPFSSF